VIEMKTVQCDSNVRTSTKRQTQKWEAKLCMGKQRKKIHYHIINEIDRPTPNLHTQPRPP